MKKAVAYPISIAMMALAGLVHLLIAPDHFAHAPAHGLFFAGIGFAQLVWVFLFWAFPTFVTWWLGLSLSGGVIVLWAATQLIVIPFAPGPEPIDSALLASKTSEWICFVALVMVAYQDRALNRRGESLPRLITSSIVWSLLMGAVYWGGGLLAEPFLPQLAHVDDEHQHDHGNQQAVAYDSTASTDSNGYDWHLPRGFPVPRVAADNPISLEKVELGRHLFYDKRLSGNGSQSCASCHHQEKAFSDGVAQSIGSTGEQHPRNASALVNVAYNSSLTWANPALIHVEKQVLVPMFGEFPVELGIVGKEEEVLARFKVDEQYQTLFAKAFPDEPDPINYSSIAKGLASFVRSLISGYSAYDRYLYWGQKDALSESAKRGMELFLSEELECHHCHIGFNFSASTVHKKTTFVENGFQNNGLYNIDGQGAYPQGNQGLIEITGEPQDMGRFRPPTLRNIELTAPYMHDGTLATLEEVIRLYERGGRLIETGEHAGDGAKNPYKSGLVPGFTITDQEREDLINFLKSLTDEQFVRDPRFSNPFEQDGDAEAFFPEALPAKEFFPEALPAP